MFSNSVIEHHMKTMYEIRKKYDAGMNISTLKLMKSNQRAQQLNANSKFLKFYIALDETGDEKELRYTLEDLIMQRLRSKTLESTSEKVLLKSHVSFYR